MIYTLYGGLKVSIFTDKIQFTFFTILILVSFFYLTSMNSNYFDINLIKQTKPDLLPISNKENYTAGLTFLLLWQLQTYFIREIGKEFMQQKIIKF